MSGAPLPTGFCVVCSSLHIRRCPGNDLDRCRCLAWARPSESDRRLLAITICGTCGTADPSAPQRAAQHAVAIACVCCGIVSWTRQREPRLLPCDTMTCKCNCQAGSQSDRCCETSRSKGVQNRFQISIGLGEHVTFPKAPFQLHFITLFCVAPLAQHSGRASVTSCIVRSRENSLSYRTLHTCATCRRLQEIYMLPAAGRLPPRALPASRALCRLLPWRPNGL